MAQRPPNNNIPNANNGNNGEGEGAENQDIPRRRSIREVTSSGVTFDPYQAAYPTLDVNFEIKGPLIAALPHFAGLDGEDPYGHLYGVHLACTSMKPIGANIDDVQLKVFHLTLEGKAKEWFRLLPRQDENALTSWVNLRRAFLEHYFPAAKIDELKKDIYSIRQDPSESFYEYWCRFQELLAKCPHHQIIDEQLIQYFHKGLLPNERGIMDASAGGSLEELPAEEAWAMIKLRARNTQQYNKRGSKGVFEVTSNPQQSKRMDSLEAKVDTLSTQLTSQLAFITSELRNLSMQQCAPSTSTALVAPSCENCGSVMHITSLCPSEPADVGAMYQGRSNANPNQKWDPHSNTYNEGWRSHPNFRWRDNVIP